jgi:tetratricopeptide (TPR) repeat protein
VDFLGHKLLGGGKTDEAIAAFASNIKRYPNSPNVYNSLGKAYEKVRKYDLAQLNYERAVHLATKNNASNLEQFRTNFERASKLSTKGGKAPLQDQ